MFNLTTLKDAYVLMCNKLQYLLIT